MNWRCAILLAASSVACSRPDTRELDSAAAAAAAAVDTQPGASGTSPSAGDTLATTGAALAVPQFCVVTDSTIGPIRLGMTFAEAKQAIPDAAFERTSDGDGAVLVGVTVSGFDLATLYADDDEDGPIDWAKQISGMETFSPECATSAGVHPGSLIVDVEKVLGKVTRIFVSEIESRQYVGFERQPEAMTFRLDYSGIFPEGARETVRFAPEAKIFSIAVRK